jgi:hypothetical protein
MELKPNSVEGFTHTFEAEVIPLLRKQKGFKDEITFIPVGQKEAVAISLWEQKENAQTYHRESYPEMLRILAKVIEGTPQVQNSEVCNSTWHNIHVPQAV